MVLNMSIKNISNSTNPLAMNPLMGLEAKYPEHCFLENVDVVTKRSFPAYLERNEKNPRKIQRHVKGIQPGYALATGTERCSFLAKAILRSIGSEHFKGWIIRDTDPKVFAYNRTFSSFCCAFRIQKKIFKRCPLRLRRILRLLKGSKPSLTGLREGACQTE